MLDLLLTSPAAFLMLFGVGSVLGAASVCVSGACKLAAWLVLAALLSTPLGRQLKSKTRDR